MSSTVSIDKLATDLIGRIDPNINSSLLHVSQGLLIHYTYTLAGSIRIIPLTRHPSQGLSTFSQIRTSIYPN